MTMRPRLSELEMSFLLNLLKETEALRKRQILNFREEKEHLEKNIHALRHKFLYETPYPTILLLQNEESKLKALEREWLPIYDKQAVLLKCLIIRLEKILSRKTGRVPHTSYFYNQYLREWNQKTPKTSETS